MPVGRSLFFRLVILTLLCGACAVVYALAREEGRAHVLRVSFLDVGQGDAIFIESPAGRQVLIDGGSTREVLRELGGLTRWYDRSIDMVVATHPDADHIGGLPDVLRRFNVSYVLRSSVEDTGSDAKAFMRAVAEEVSLGARDIVAERGQVFDIGGARIEVLFPDRDMRGVETNTGSIALRIVHGETSFLLTGDAPAGIEEYLVRLHGGSLNADVLKVGHHGSNTSSSLLFLGYAAPEYGVFSRGCDNRYGHPHAEVVERFARLGIQTLDTCEEGTITFISDGRSVRRAL